jgi:phage FluMu protein Com
VAETSTKAETWMDRTFEPFRCRTCQKLLLKITPVALKAGAALEIKCGCKTMNYMMGRDQ